MTFSSSFSRPPEMSHALLLWAFPINVDDGKLHHTDDVYVCNSEFGEVDLALEEARAKGWTVVGMNWRTIF